MKYSIQMHAARHLHYDLRLQIGSVLKSWVLPKGPSLSPKERRLAILTEDHALSYAHFEGRIEEGYGKGAVLLWDRGSFRTIRKNAAGKEVALAKSFAEGHLDIWIDGQKLKGGFSLIHFKESNWLLIKKRDAYADDAFDVVTHAPRSVKSKKLISEL